MKIALCISGQPRKLAKSIDLLKKNLIEPNGIEDIFVHTWFSEDMVDKTIPSTFGSQGNFQADTENIIKSSLSPKGYKQDPPSKFSKYNELHPDSVMKQSNVFSAFYSMFVSNALKLQHEVVNDFKYDVVIKTRFDLNYFSPVIIKDLVDDKLSKAFYVASKYHVVPERMPDTFVFGNSPNMDLLASLFMVAPLLNIKSNVETINCPEAYFYRYVTKTGFEIVAKPIDYQLLDHPNNHAENLKRKLEATRPKCPHCKASFYIEPIFDRNKGVGFYISK